MVDVILAVSLPQFDGCDNDGLLAIADLLGGAIIKASKRPRSKAGLQPCSKGRYTSGQIAGAGLVGTLAGGSRE
ncbi:hypothetical protein NEUTE1DRAFT_117554 [Neurospora tetrasperma FGSC 2508]|uniref:Uncharacterized protein n=1 Tax=Neurospora tetrasperma (strain FGSC 2508 / ATCC MYA-4615 / P0657) TaxID=510951 RepID=F8MNT9_NEUT8|nr:uncharacterized protein NEUTE1DRAFT_117554 [Neurospora tetrasperma FGSC 2508]EGO57004.1 hypothetical protein NEUTE1DRAFT_117554 [Neurospora tetrasperma FGSC 2508]EGZ70093.1 hypothetical protein NEUTE2DRAFT_144929 [Neurospora tetrasperma FGSC 2509]